MPRHKGNKNDEVRMRPRVRNSGVSYYESRSDLAIYARLGRLYQNKCRDIQKESERRRPRRRSSSRTKQDRNSGRRSCSRSPSFGTYYNPKLPRFREAPGGSYDCKRKSAASISKDSDKRTTDKHPERQKAIIRPYKQERQEGSLLHNRKGITHCKQEASAHHHKQDTSLHHYKKEIPAKKHKHQASAEQCKQEVPLQHFKKEASAEQYKQEVLVQHIKQEDSTQLYEPEAAINYYQPEVPVHNYHQPEVPWPSHHCQPEMSVYCPHHYQPEMSVYCPHHYQQEPFVENYQREENYQQHACLQNVEQPTGMSQPMGTNKIIFVNPDFLFMNPPLQHPAQVVNHQNMVPNFNDYNLWPQANLGPSFAYANPAFHQQRQPSFNQQRPNVENSPHIGFPDDRLNQNWDADCGHAKARS